MKRILQVHNLETLCCSPQLCALDPENCVCGIVYTGGGNCKLICARFQENMDRFTPGGSCKYILAAGRNKTVYTYKTQGYL